MLRKAVDPVPPFLTDEGELDGKKIGIVRAFQASVPVIVRGTGAVYSRDAGGKVPIASHRELLEMARQGESAASEVRLRPTKLPLIAGALQTPDVVDLADATHPTHVRAAR